LHYIIIKETNHSSTKVIEVNFLAMNIFNKLQQLQQLHELIAQGNTGRPENLATALGVTRARLYMLIDELKSLNHSINYSRRKQTFYYHRAGTSNSMA
jgi:predicted DNA-binding transcriptional regulator YafY